MRTLVLYYSRTGHSRTVAEAVARGMGCDAAEITCEPYQRWYGPLLRAWDVFAHRLPAIEVPALLEEPFDLVIVGGPVWYSRPAPPVLSLLAAHGAAIDRVGLFVTCSGAAEDRPEPALSEMAALVPGRVIATAIFREPDVAWGAYRGAVAEFVHRLISRATISAAVRELRPG